VRDRRVAAVFRPPAVVIAFLCALCVCAVVAVAFLYALKAFLGVVRVKSIAFAVARATPARLPYTRSIAMRRHNSQRRLNFLLIASIFVAATLLAANDHPKPKPPLVDFYVVTQAIFHSDPKWVDHILEVRPQNSTDVEVREIRIAPLSPACPHHVTVRAIERVVPDTTIKKVAAHFDLCAFTEDDVESMIHAAKRKPIPTSDEDSATQTIVARCGNKQRLFELPDQSTLRFDGLSLADTHLTAFWNLAATVEARTFGDDFSLAHLTPVQDRDAQALGAKLVPEIKSGKYDQAFADNTCPYAECQDHNATSALEGYAGPIFACPEK
jgi:hypothetical protein